MARGDPGEGCARKEEAAEGFRKANGGGEG